MGILSRLRNRNRQEEPTNNGTKKRTVWDKIRDFLNSAFNPWFRYIAKTDKDVLNKKDFHKLLESLGHHMPTDREIKRLLRRLHDDDDMYVNFEDFLDIMAPRARDMDLQEEVIRAFEVLKPECEDEDNTDGVAAASVLEGADIEGETIQELMDDDDLNIDGQINYYEFARLIGQ